MTVNARLIRSISELRSTLSEARSRGERIGLVPTMGALHSGHGRLIEVARRETSFVVVSIFVNPAQFDRNDDYERYPRNLVPDLKFCDALAVDVVFAPEVEEMYPAPQVFFVDPTVLADHLCGRFRPGHFRGVATVVLKLFHIVQPHRAYFGEKDAQQLAIVRGMAQDLNVPVTIVAVPTVREADGLAMSSRNQRLNAEERGVAAALYKALQIARKRIADGAVDPVPVRVEALAAFDSLPGLRVEYLEIVDPEHMRPVGRIAGPVMVAAAIWAGSTRLIDNVLCGAE